MSVVALIIKLIKRKKKMNEELEIGTFTPNTHPVLTALNEKVTKLENDLSILTAERDALKNKDEFVSAQLKKWSDKYRLTESSLQDLLKEMLDDEEIEFDAAKKIAELFDNVNLSKQITIRYTISADVLVEMPYNADADEVANDIYLDRTDFATYHGDADILETDTDVEDWRVIS
jgi:predicted nuclease with TOPRIM domain